MHVSTVCKYNQARSIIGAAAIRTIFPEISVFSAGVQATDTLIPEQVRMIAQRWGIPVDEKFSTAVSSSVKILTNSDLIIAADEEVAYLLGENVKNKSLVNLQEVATAIEFTPHDPTGMQGAQMDIELAKVVALTIQEVITFLKLRAKNEIVALIPRTPQAEARALAFAHEANGANGFIIDLNLRTPDKNMWTEQAVPVSLIKGEFTKELAKIIAAKNKKQRKGIEIFAPAFEISDPESVWLSRDLVDLILKMSELAHVTILTAPLILPNAPLADAYFAAITAKRVEVIS
jgi:protein-tyrosine-phosphatase